MIRTFNGQEFEAHLTNPSSQRVDSYKRAGIRCRLRGNTLFVHTLDIDEAKTFDAKMEGFYG